jgi:hypothetical protein
MCAAQALGVAFRSVLGEVALATFSCSRLSGQTCRGLPVY